MLVKLARSWNRLPRQSTRLKAYSVDCLSAARGSAI
jgi:hypothetical protein